MSDNGGFTYTDNETSFLCGLSEGRSDSLGYSFDKRENFLVPNMAFSQPFGGFTFSSQGSYPSTMQSPPMGTIPGMIGTPTAAMTNQPPEWAAALINDVKTIKSKVSKIENIEAAINSMCGKIKELETNVESIDKRVETVERSCSFISSQHDDHKKELENTKKELKAMKSTCANLEQNTNSLQKDKSMLQSKINDLEYRSMRDNLLFYGIPEHEGEDCELRVRQFLGEKLELPQAERVSFDRVHRVGPASIGKTRPKVAKFHYYKEREFVRNKSFELKDKLKAENVGVGAQWPKQMRDTRKALYDVMQQEKNKGHTVKLVKDKLFVNGHLYVSGAATAGTTTTSTPAPQAAGGT